MPRDLEAELRAVLSAEAGRYRAAPDAVERIDGRVTRRQRQRHLRNASLAAAAAVTLVVVVGALLVGRSGSATRQIHTIDRAPTTTAAKPTLPAAPWSAPSVPAADAPPKLLQSWNAYPYRVDCPALTFTGPAVGHGATVRIPQMDGWAVAYDEPGLLGSDPNGRVGPGANGRSAFGISGGSLTELANLGKTIGQTLPDLNGEKAAANTHWADGSAADLLQEGAQWSAVIWLAGHNCQYNVWTYSGQQHLEQLVAGLRFVQGAP